MKRNKEILIDVLRVLEDAKLPSVTGKDIIHLLKEKKYEDGDILYNSYLLCKTELIQVQSGREKVLDEIDLVAMGYAYYRLTNLGHDLLENDNKKILLVLKKHSFNFMVEVLKSGGAAAIIKLVS